MIDPSARIHETAIVEDGVTIGPRTALWDGVHLRQGARIGADCIVGEKSYLAGDVVVGDRVKINAHVYLCAGITLEDGVMVSAHVVFTNDPAPRATSRDLSVLRPSEPGAHTLRTVVSRGASIGANATIGPGIKLGAFSLVGMGAVVTRDVPPFGLVVGNPARLVGMVDRDGRKVHSFAEPSPRWPPDGRYACPGDGAIVVHEGVVTHEP